MLHNQAVNLMQPTLLAMDAQAGNLQQQQHTSLEHGFITLATGMAAMAASDTCNLHSNWQRGTAATQARTGAAELAAAARQRSLQKTPLPMILARMKVLLERLHLIVKGTPQCTCPSGAAASTQALQTQQHHLPTSRQLVDTCRDRPTSRPTPPHTTSTAVQSWHASNSSSSRALTGAAKGGAKKQMLAPSINGAKDSLATAMSEQNLLVELEAMFCFISEFLRSLPSATRQELSKVARLESYKKDQIIYDIGDHPEHFYIVMGGRIQIWSHPPGALRPKSIVSVLGRGEAFGDQAMISAARHCTAASPACNTSLLVVSKEDFLSVLGSHFQGVAASRNSFLEREVAPLTGAPATDVKKLCTALVSTRPAAGKVWDLQEEQIYFIKAGVFELQLIDLEAQKAADAAVASAIAATSAITATAAPLAVHAPAEGPDARLPTAAKTAATGFPEEGLLIAAVAAAAAADGADTLGQAPSQFLGDTFGDAPALSQHGVLASVRVCNGRALGTLGLERELQKSRQAKVPRKTIAQLSTGDWFGGGLAVIGNGPIQSALRIVSKGKDCEVVHAHLDSISQSILSRLRDDAAFKFTYYLGRLGILPLGAAVGHMQSSLIRSVAAPAQPAAVADGINAAGVAAAVPGNTTLPSVACGESSSVRELSAASSLQQRAVMASIGLLNGSVLGKNTAASAALAATGLGFSTRDAVGSNKGGAITAEGEPLGMQPSVADATGSASCVAKRSSRRQQHVHAAGSGTFSPGVMAAWQHVQGLQADFSSDQHCVTNGQLQASRPASAPAKCHAGVSSGPRGSAASSFMLGAVSTDCGGSIPCAGMSAAKDELCTKQPWQSSSSTGAHDAGHAAAGCGGLTTAAERYWRSCDRNCNSGTGAALPPLLHSLFPEGLQPLVAEVDALVAQAQVSGKLTPCTAVQQQYLLQKQPYRRPQPVSMSGHLQQHAMGISDFGLVSSSSTATTAIACQHVMSGAGQPAALCSDSNSTPCSPSRSVPQTGQSGSRKSRIRTCSKTAGNMLQHKPISSLLAASVLWQHDSDASFRPPLRQCLTTTEIFAQQQLL